jgi:ABC-type antimicrobial peptide transport system permease subunit
MALGAKPGRVMRMVLGETLSLLIIGLAIGIPAAIGVTRGVASMLYGLKPADPISIAFAVTLMIIVAVFSGLVPARRASRVNPIEALREE